ncbi:MAG: hypothetical protein JWR35_260 [Marmoricola sp.]|nr:hypothetical protein [Marmoricola sp.]
MPHGQHSLKTQTPRTRRIALVTAPLVTLLTVGAGVALTETGTSIKSPTAQSAASTVAHAVSASAQLGSRDQGPTRSLDRLASLKLSRGPAVDLPKVIGTRWSTDSLNVWSLPTEKSNLLGEIPASSRLRITGRHLVGFTEVIRDDKSRWVHTEYVSAKKPATPASMGLNFTPCPESASVMTGLVPNMIRAWEAVCHNFPQITTYGGLGPRPEHDTGHAVDAMTNDPTVGYAIAAFLQAHAAELDIFDIIYRQHIWTPVRASEGWRLMPDRGSATANHFDHVHFGVN